MRFAITAADRSLCMIEDLSQAGWTLVKLFAAPVDPGVDGCEAVIDFARRHGAIVQADRLGETDLEDLRQRGCEILIVTAYPWRIPAWEPYLAYAVTIQCSPLPEGRCPDPLPRAILQGRETWGVTCHRVTPELYRGDILAIEWFALDSEECHESLDLKVQIATRSLAARLAGDFSVLWREAQPQGAGGDETPPRVEERVIDFGMPVAAVLRHVRAFGRRGSLTVAGHAWIAVARATGWSEPHGHAPGRIVHIGNQRIVVAAADGYVALLEARLVDPFVMPALAARPIPAGPSRAPGR